MQSIENNLVKNKRKYLLKNAVFRSLKIIFLHEVHICNEEEKLILDLLLIFIDVGRK